MVQAPSLAEFTALQQALEQARLDQKQAEQAVQALRGELRMAQAERDLLQERLNQFKRQLFAAKSEASSQHQRDMFFNEAESLGAHAEPAREEAEDEGIEGAPHQRKKRADRRPLDPALPREVIRHELPEDQRVCPHDGAALREIGVEASEQLDIVPQQVRVIRHERVKYACPCCDGALRLAPKPAQVIPKGLLSEGSIAWVVAAKYLDGLPLYRQCVLLGRFGGTDLSRSTLSATVVRVGQSVQPVINLMRDLLLESPVVHGDETGLQALKEAGRKAQTKSYMWAQMCEGSGGDGTGPPIRLFAYAPGRSTALAQPLYAGMRGGSALMTDGYEPYNAIAQTHGLVHLGCWAHCRRYFNDALQALPKERRGPDSLSARFIDLICQLYRVEALARQRGVGVQELHQLRQRDSVPVLAQIEALLLSHLHGVLPNSLLGKALHYLSAQWSKLTRYVEDGRYPIDNNPCENAIRPFAVGRRSWLFCDTVAGANASANLYSLLQTCQVNGIDGYRYLRELLIALPKASTADDYEALLPWRLTPRA